MSGSWDVPFHELFVWGFESLDQLHVKFFSFSPSSSFCFIKLVDVWMKDLPNFVSFSNFHLELFLKLYLILSFLFLLCSGKIRFIQNLRQQSSKVPSKGLLKPLLFERKVQQPKRDGKHCQWCTCDYSFLY